MIDSIYLDNQATTPTDPRVREAMLPLLALDNVGNPHSEHFAGRKASNVVEKARREIAELIGARPQEIIFTSGATEANNIALQGIARANMRRGRHIITSATEHKCVLQTLRMLENIGFLIDVLPVGRNGLIDLDQLSETITDKTTLVSVMTANNEIGVLQPIEKIAEICQSRDVVFHSDAAQAAGKIQIDVKASGIDLMSLSGHKMYAPIGIGALYVSDECPVLPEPLFGGGGQERGMRPGTLAPVLCTAMGAACYIAMNEIENDAKSSLAHRHRFLEIFKSFVPDVRVNCEDSPRLPGNLSLTLPDIDADRLVGTVQPQVMISTNAACSSGMVHPSHVLLALGLNEIDAASTIRVSFGRFNTAAEIESAARCIGSAAARIRSARSDSVAAQ